MADRAARLAGDLGRSHRSRIAGAGDGLILRGRARTRIRRVVRRLGGCRRPRSHVRWPARRRPVLAGRLPDQCTARLVALWLTRRYVGEGRVAAPSGSLDLPGTVLTALALAGLSVGAISGQQRGWSNPSAFVALGIGAIATALLPWWMLRAPDPLVPPALFRSRNFTVTNLSTLVIYAALAVTFYYLTLFLQGPLGYSAAAAGVATMPGVLLRALFSSRLGGLSARYGARWLLTLGPMLMAVGVLWLSGIPSTSPAWDLGAA